MSGHEGTAQGFRQVFLGLAGIEKPSLRRVLRGGGEGWSSLSSFMSPLRGFPLILIESSAEQMSSTYEAIQSRANQYWLFERANLIDEFKDSKGPLPPPLNIITVFGKLLMPLCCSKSSPTAVNVGFRRCLRACHMPPRS